jgi:hypothetical protein
LSSMAGDAGADFGEHLAVFVGGGVADGVGHVDGGCAGFDGDADHLDEEVAVGAGGVFGENSTSSTKVRARRTDSAVSCRGPGRG